MKQHERLCSDLTQRELGQATAELTEQLKALTDGFKIIAISDQMRELANAYVQEGVVPARYFDDALHMAAVVLGDADVLVSWNFKHLVRRNTRLLVNYVNAQRGLRSIEILAPPEL
ncbi:MAG: hypothetical protein AB1566_04355 [Chloroflexota bacterium]